MIKYIGVILICLFMSACNQQAYAAWGGGLSGHNGYFHSGNNRIHHRLRHMRAQHFQSYVEGGIHVTP